MIRAAIGLCLLQYMRKLPQHRGKQRLARAISRFTGPVVVKVFGDIRFRVWAHDAMSRSYVSDDALGSVLVSELLALPVGARVLNIGAHAGLAAILAAQKVTPGGQVWALEPNSLQFLELLQNLKLNGTSGVIPLNVAVATQCGTAELIYSEDHTGTGYLSQNGGEDRNAGWRRRQQVVVTDGLFLDKIIGNGGLDLVIIDVEGAEVQVTQSIRSILRRTRRVVVEVTDRFLSRFGDSKDDLYQLFSELGFQGEVRSTDWQYDQVFARRSDVG